MRSVPRAKFVLAYAAEKTCMLRPDDDDDEGFLIERDIVVL